MSTCILALEAAKAAAEACLRAWVARLNASLGTP